jgi:hypothetical protein
MNKDLWVISEFEDIKEYAAYTIRLKVRFENNQEDELQQIVIAEDGYKAEEIAIKWVLSRVAWNIKEVLHSSFARYESVLITDKDAAVPEGIYFVPARGSGKMNPITRALQAAAEIPEDIFCELALKARDLDKNSPIYNMILEQAKEWGVGITDTEDNQ